ncbi:hypothetical protein [Blastococcus deserti]
MTTDSTTESDVAAGRDVAPRDPAPSGCAAASSAPGTGDAAAPATATAGAPCATVSPATSEVVPADDDPGYCAPAPVAASSDSASPAASPAGGQGDVADRSTTALAHRSVTGTEPAGVAAAAPVTPAAAPVTQASDESPLAPPAPLPLPPLPSTTVGGAGCSGQGATDGSQRGGTAAAAVLGAPLQISLAVNDAGHTAPAAGSPTTTATDPATRPD